MPSFPFRIVSIKGLVPYDEGRALQKQLIEKRAAGEIPDTILFLEHEAVVTQGRGLQRKAGEEGGPRHMPRPAMLPPEIGFSETERGGDLTYHGPGQLVVYPLVSLKPNEGPWQNLEGYLRGMEQVFIDLLSEFGLDAEAKAGATGVWAEGKKYVSMGIAVRKWVTYHGAALNVVNDLSAFRWISPCGYSPEVMARLADVCPSFLGQDWRTEVEATLARIFDEKYGTQAEFSQLKYEAKRPASVLPEVSL